MEKFNFKFDKVLNYKSTVETVKKANYGKLKEELNKEEDILNGYYDHKEDMKTKKNEEVANTKIGNMQLYSKYLNDLKNKIEKQENVVVNKRIDVDKSKEELVQASKEKKIFERLKENKHEEYLYLEKLSEDKIVDNLVSYRSNARG